MSAFLCTAAHFDALADYAKRYHIMLDVYRLPASARTQAGIEFGRDAQTVDLSVYPARVARILRAENVRSLAWRYGAADQPAYAYTPTTKPLPDAAALSAVRCLAYQSNETRDWEETLAHAICAAIEDAAVSNVSGSSPWGVEEKHVR